MLVAISEKTVNFLTALFATFCRKEPFLIVLLSKRTLPVKIHQKLPAKNLNCNFRNCYKKLLIAINMIIISLFFICCSVETPQSHYDKLPSGEPTGLYAQIEVSCKTILDNTDKLDPDLNSYVPSDGVIIKKSAEIRKNDTAMKFLTDILNAEKILFIESAGYISSIGHISEKCCGAESGWLIKVNGEFLNTGAKSYYVKSGDKIQWLFSCKKGDLYDGE